MNPDKISLSYEQAIKFLITLVDFPVPVEIDNKRNQLTAYNADDQKQFKFNFPLIVNPSENIIKDKNFLHTFINHKPSFLLALIQAGHAALGLYRNDRLLQHKVIRKYMTRKKQGKAQLKYLKTKGKSRAGSRIRLANTVLFFEEINQYLNAWKPAQDTTIIYSCTPVLWGMLFKSKTAPPFQKKDPRLKKLPLSIDVPNIDVLKNAAQFSQKGQIYIFPQCSEDNKRWLFSSVESINTE